MNILGFFLAHIPHGQVVAGGHPQHLPLLIGPFQLGYLLVVQIFLGCQGFRHVPDVPQLYQLLGAARTEDVSIKGTELD